LAGKSMTVSHLAGPKTAKRKIQIRQYLADHRSSSTHSDPFLPLTDSDSQIILTPRLRKFSFQSRYFPDEPPEEVDEILSKKVDLDAADRFVASLRINTKGVPAPKHVQKISKLKAVEAKLLATAGMELENLSQIQLADCIEPSEEDDEII
jgi:hypothetical protein